MVILPSMAERDVASWHGVVSSLPMTLCLYLKILLLHDRKALLKSCLPKLLIDLDPTCNIKYAGTVVPLLKNGLGVANGFSAICRGIQVGAMSIVPLQVLFL